MALAKLALVTASLLEPPPTGSNQSFQPPRQFEAQAFDVQIGVDARDNSPPTPRRWAFWSLSVLWRPCRVLADADVVRVIAVVGVAGAAVAAAVPAVAAVLLSLLL